ncbi:MAG TPA: MGMT family protein [Candidatus Paceibacterota bacterium]|jgi:O-6-methylguanine DNA methyltransferase|nr:MGMT family protein [Candidatus Paceibacterota bacterium]
MKTSSQTFAERVRKVVARIPRGKVMTYAEVARRAGNAQASRAVGNIMRKNFDASIPCHRVVRSDGKIGNYNRGGASAKMKRLKEEGVDLERLKLHA